MSLPIVLDSYPAIAPAKYVGHLKGKVAVVTGSSGGIGAAVAKAFAVAGATVAAVARREDELNAVVKDINSSGGKAVAFTADISDKAVAKPLIARITKDLGEIDILINNAGVMRISTLAGEPEDLDIWWKVYETNVLGPVSLIRAVLPSMIQRKTGIIMSTTSRIAADDFPALSAYASSKAAITRIHASLAQEAGESGVLSFTVDPGAVQTGVVSSTNALNTSDMGHPAVQSLFEIFKSLPNYQSTALCADTMVALSTNPAAAALNGRVVNAYQDLTAVLDEASKEGKGRIGSERLYSLNIPTL